MNRAEQGASDRRYMGSALSLARRGVGMTGANPSVGCVIIGADGRLLGRGATAPGGRPHAEALALANARTLWGDAAEDMLSGATAYVTLEPCAHHGATPPCADALVKARIARVVTALDDPDPRVAGLGVARLREAGVDVTTGVLREEAREALQGYLLNREASRPRLTLKLASTLDGRIATASGESRWISCPDALARAHAIRASSDVILIGSGTAQADDPALSVRLPGLEASSPARAVADSQLRTPMGAKLMQSAKQRPLYLFHAADAPEQRRVACAEAGAILIEAPRAQCGGLDPAAILTALGRRGHLEAMCEGGGRLAAALIRADLVDRLICVHAGLAIGADGIPSVGPLALERLSDAPRFELTRSTRLGADVLSEWRRVLAPL